MPVPDQAKIEQLKAANPGRELHLITAASEDGSRSECVVVKVPDRDRWMRFKEHGQDKNRRALAIESLLRDCVVYPSDVELDAMIQKRPGLVETFGVEVGELAGLEEKVLSVKL